MKGGEWVRVCSCQSRSDPVRKRSISPANRGGGPRRHWPGTFIRGVDEERGKESSAGKKREKDLVYCQQNAEKAEAEE